MKIILCGIVGLVASALGVALMIGVLSIIGWPAYRLMEGDWERSRGEDYGLSALAGLFTVGIFALSWLVGSGICEAMHW